ncbi:MAG: glycerol-3-phosphate acyltransferase [Chloroflexi bacterium]|nr:glycerol-3-phosphate acyltransferase [Chloroflexota bacterium]
MPTIDAFILSILLAYLLGSIPVATLVSRRRSIDIFSTGTGLPGAANVFRQVGHKWGFMVSAGDAAKGALAIVVASRLGMEGTWLLLPATAAIGGHWNSIFSRFRGGDGLATLMGITIVAVPVYGLIPIVVGGVVGLWFHGNAHPSLRGGFAGFGFLLARAVSMQEDVTITFGIATIGLMVLAHAVIGHHRRRDDLPDYDPG